MTAAKSGSTNTEGANEIRPLGIHTPAGIMRRSSTKDIEIRRTRDYEAVRRLALDAGLEDGSFTGVVVAFGAYSGDDLVGCAALKQTDTAFSVEWLAVSEPLRGKGFGKRLVAEVELEARQRGARRLWALARAPEFFRGIGFRLAHEYEEGGLTMSGCKRCPQYQRNCTPSIVVKDF